VSPEGSVVATFPAGDAITQSFGPIGFKITGFYSAAISNALASGSVTLTYQIPQASTSVGYRRIFAFFQPSSASNFQSFLVGSVTFQVPQPSNLPSYLQDLWDGFQFVASWAFLTGIVKFAFDHYPDKWVRGNWPIIFGGILFMIFLVLRFFVF
jgi:hypothetical protein